MKKFFLSFFVIAASAGYVVYQYVGGGSASASLTSTQQVQGSSVVQPLSDASILPTPPASELPTKSTPAVVVADPKQSTSSSTKPKPISPVSELPTKNTPTPAPVLTPKPKPVGQYKDGTYTGLVVQGYYGPVQMQAVIKGGKLVAINALQYPTDRQNSRRINTFTIPVLISEAIEAQSANVSAVSGASVTSPAFMETLADALSQAKNI